MSFSIEELGITREELIQRVVERLCNSVLHDRTLNEDGNEVEIPSSFSRTLQEAVKQRANETIAKIATDRVIPHVDHYIETLVLEATNRWGEKTGERITFLEYLVKRAEDYLREDVNYEGKGKDEVGYGSWVKTQTRIAHMVHKHLHYSIESAMKTAMANANSLIAQGIHETVKIKLNEIGKKLKVEMKS